jgi:hypothetical protein
MSDLLFEGLEVRLARCVKKPGCLHAKRTPSLRRSLKSSFKLGFHAWRSVMVRNFSQKVVSARSLALTYNIYMQDCTKAHQPETHGGASSF